MAIHHRFTKGKKVFVALRDGSTIVDKFMSSNSNYFILQNSKLKWNEIRCTDIYIPRIQEKIS